MSDGLLIDNFAGGGGASTGIQAAFGRPVDIAINHDPEAIAMHKTNHPQTLHLTENVFQVSPKKICGNRSVDLAWFSPDCTHFSRAKGGQPTRDRKIRGLAWVAVRWAFEVKPKLICLENVEEFLTWGPLKNGYPDPTRKGQYFRTFISRLSNLGYHIEWKVLTASNYGSPTSRKRFFLIARADGEPIQWPEITHGKGKIPHRTAAECIDWSIPTHSIFIGKDEAKKLNIRRPLAESTLHRIARGVQKFIIESNDPFLLNENQAAAFMGYHYTGHNGYDLRNPLKTVTAYDHHTLVTALLSKYHGLKSSESRGSDLNEPLLTLDSSNRFGLVSAFISKFRGTNIGTDIRDPLQTVSAGGQHHAQVSAFLMKYYGQGIGHELNKPIATLCGKEKFALVTIRGEQYKIMDIGLRMLAPRELATAQGFPPDYKLTGSKKSQVARIGNSVPPQVVTAIIRANIQSRELSIAES